MRDLETATSNAFVVVGVTVERRKGKIEAPKRNHNNVSQLAAALARATPVTSAPASVVVVHVHGRAR